MEEEREIIYYMLNTRDFQGQESQLILLNDSFVESRVYMYIVAILTESKLIENKISFKLFHRGNISSSRYHTMFKVTSFTNVGCVQCCKGWEALTEH